MSNAGVRRRRLLRLSGAGFLLLSVLSILLSLGAPGLGWGLATVTMIAISLCSRVVGRRWLWGCLIVTLVHFASLGPLVGRAGESFGSNWFTGVVFAAAPFVFGIVALVGTYFRQK